MTIAAARPYRQMFVFEVTHASTLVFDSSNRSTGTGTAVSSGNITTTGTEEINVGSYGDYSGGGLSAMQINGVAADGTLTVSGGFDRGWHRRTTATYTGQATATSDTGGEWSSHIISFKESSGAPAPIIFWQD